MTNLSIQLAIIRLRKNKNVVLASKYSTYHVPCKNNNVLFIVHTTIVIHGNFMLFVSIIILSTDVFLCLYIKM